jgi:hypothetical protein
LCTLIIFKYGIKNRIRLACGVRIIFRTPDSPIKYMAPKNRIANNYKGSRVNLFVGERGKDRREFCCVGIEVKRNCATVVDGD